MRFLIWLISLSFVFTTKAAPASWDGLLMASCDMFDPNCRMYDTGGYIYSPEGVATLHGILYGHYEEGGFYLKAYDYLHSSKPVRNAWILAYYGQILGPATVGDAELLELGGNFIGGTRVDDPSDFYLGFWSSVYGVEDGTTWYGWVHVSIDDLLDIHVLGSGINLFGGPVTVGVEPTPEPSSMVLVLLGLGALGLKRRPRARHQLF